MSKNIEIQLENIDSAIAQIEKERSELEKLSAKIQQLTFATKTMSTGKCATAMHSLTSSDLAAICAAQIELMEKTIALLRDAKTKFNFVDRTLAEKISS